MELIKKSWNDISINDYYEIVDIIDDDSRSEMDKEVATIAVLCDCTEDTIYNLTLPEVKKLTGEIGFLKKFDFDKRWDKSRIRIKGVEYDVCVDLQKMTISQYIDFQTFWGKRDLRTYYGNILACFIIPKGCKYGDGYDIAALAQEFRDTISISMANAVCFFFLKDLAISTKVTQAYLEWTMRRMRKKAPTEEIRSQMEEIERQLVTLRYNMDGFLS